MTVLFDLRAWFVLNGSLALLMAVVMLCLRVSYPPTIRGLGHWSVAGVAAFVSTLLFAGRSVIPDLWSILVANTLLLLNAALYFVGLCRFYGTRTHWYRISATLAITMGLLAWLTYVHPSFNSRVVVVSLVWSGLLVAVMFRCWRNGPRRFPVYFTITACALLVLVLWWRAAMAWWVGVELQGGGPSSGDVFYIASHTLAVVAFGVGLILQSSERLRAEYVQLASRDSLTNTLTRRVFYDAFAKEMARTVRYKRNTALLVLDIDHFKQVNDTYGHQVGDRVLVSFAKRVTSLLRRPDLLARLGGEEFAVLLPETTLEEAKSVAQRILTRVAEPGDEGAPTITVSIGIAMNQADESTFDALMVRADQALYRAKAQGRNRMVAI
jgi:diguanylate cyclase (GGDEF)-like protein